VNAALRTVVLLALPLLASPGAGQEAAPPVDRAAAMRRFDTWIGEWLGSGWSLDAAGRRTEFSLTEKVQSRVGGTVLLIEGRGTARADDGSETVTHDGLVLVSWDEHAGRYRWNGHEARAGTVDADIVLLDDGLQWSLAGGGAAVRFTIRFDERRWHEIGEASTDGKAWTVFMAMDLDRASPR